MTKVLDGNHLEIYITYSLDLEKQTLLGRHMADMLIRIKSLLVSFSKAQRRLAEYVIANCEDIPFMSVHELADAAGVSVASISRFARVVGCESYKEFKTQLGKESLATFNNIYQAITPKDNESDIIDKVFSGNIKSLEETLRILNKADLVRAVEKIAKCHRLVFFGIGSSGYLVQDAALRFSQLDMQAEAYVDSYQILNQSLRLKKGDVAFGLSHSGRSAITVEALNLALKSGATTIGISNYLRSPLHKVSSIFLCTSFPESRVKVAALSSRIAQMGLIDAVYLLVARHKRITLSKAELLNAQTERVLRLSQ